MSTICSKRVVQEGRGLYCPNQLASVEVNVVGRYCTSDSDGDQQELFDQREKTSMEIGEASGVLSQILEDCVSSMRTGEKCELEIDMQTLRDTSSDSIPWVPADCNMIKYSIHLLSFKRGKDVWKLSDQERIEIARHHKTLGTDNFKTGDIRAAAVHYSKSLKYLIPIKLDELCEETIRKDMLALTSLSLLNLAACQLKFKQDHHAAQNCTKVLEIEPENVKALYRRGLALINMNHFDQAREDLIKARRLEPSNHAIEDQLRSLEAKVQVQKTKYRDALKTMFRGKT